jgi:hypothetical protein
MSDPTPQEMARDMLRELTERQSAWTQHKIARDVHGDRVGPKSPDAVCWCILGHINKRTETIMAADAAARAFMARLPKLWQSSDLCRWNDHPRRTVADVIALCERVAQGGGHG